MDQEDWPSLEEILTFRDRVRERLRGIYDQITNGSMELTRHVARVLFMTFEHEAQHAETLLYMLVQSSSTRAPTANATPQWEHLAARWQAEARPNTVLTISGGSIQLGHDDAENEDASQQYSSNHEFGWDCENPAATCDVKTFKVDALPITNDDYMSFLKTSKPELDWTDESALPASWTLVDGRWHVRTLYGPVTFEHAGLWPLMASKCEIDDYAKSKGGRMPTEAELQLLWKSQGGPRPTGRLANVAFKHWHPVP